ncbi:hypothetical protein HQQ94_06395 [Shewanella sp. VB17]|uniref:S41 family peptidase n=1 Tax=Shewanella sp. VB17 TaxID=2739432 RepID=UPI00156545E3|nr:S41 family peptidase [Shewanella sp. VB17]NRD72873.1 hypothetical protein [Shewanella sp. VB17]
MFKPFLLPLVLVISFQLSATDTPPSITTDLTDNPWAELATKDLQQIYQTTKANHPGAVDDENPYFQKWLEEGYLEGLERATQASSLQDAMNSLIYYVAGFADGHFGIRFNYQARYQSWAGLGIKKQGNDYNVTYRELNWPTPLPPIGATLTSCDKRSTPNIMQEDLLRYRFNNNKLNARKVRYAPKLLIHDGIGERSQANHCDFTFNGNTHSFELTWNSIDSTKLTDKLNTGVLPSQFTLLEFLPHHYWLTLPTFNTNAVESTALKDIIEQIKQLRNSEMIVLDVRGNGGGNSQWGVDIAQAIYGKQYIEELSTLTPDNSYALWRVSPDNLANLSSIQDSLIQQFGGESDITQSFIQTQVNMKEALENNQKYVKQAQSESEITHEKTKPVPSRDLQQLTTKPSYQGKTILLTDSYCGSACLDFADLSLSIPGLIHVGEETSADTVYMDIRIINLNSGLGRFSLAQKVYRKRLRGNNESYLPQYIFKGDMTNTKGLQKWIIDTVNLSK